jgi:hypothetical protein
MNWLRKRVIAWVREDWDESNRMSGGYRHGEQPVAIGDDDVGLEDPIRFDLQSVIGGHLLRVRQPYNHKTDRQPSTTYIIQSGEDIGARIAKIVSMELLK